MTTIKQLSNSLGAAREQAQLSVTELAERAGVARAALYRFAQGGDIRLSTFLAMADTLGVDMILAPKTVSMSLQASVAANAVSAAKMAIPTPTGPRSAVEARLARVRAGIQAQVRKQTP